MPGFKVEVQTGGNTFGKGAEWNSNALVFATEEEATTEYGEDLFCRWTAVNNWRIKPTEEEPNYSFINGKLTKKGE